jgi:HEAT repeat protein
MRTLIALLVLSPLAQAQEAAQKPNYFPPVGQLLGAPDQTLPVKALPADFDTLAARLHSRDAGVRKAAISAMGSPGNIRAIPYLGALVLQLNEPVEVRVAAAMALGRIGNWRCLTFLKPAVKDSAKEVRFAATLAVGKTKAPDGLVLLINALQRDPEWWVRFAAAVALADNRDPMSVEALGRAASTEPEWQVRMQAVRSLGQIGSRDAAYALAKPLKDSDAGVRAATAMALGDIGGIDSLNLLAAALHEEREEFPRQVMADTLKKLLARP